MVAIMLLHDDRTEQHMFMPRNTNVVLDQKSSTSIFDNFCGNIFPIAGECKKIIFIYSIYMYMSYLLLRNIHTWNTGHIR